MTSKCIWGEIKVNNNLIRGNLSHIFITWDENLLINFVSAQFKLASNNNETLLTHERNLSSILYITVYIKGEGLKG